MSIKKSDRIDTLDFTKGVLVLLMVLYHGMNYLGNLTLPHEYLKFLPPSFIFITGFIITHIYLNRSEAGSSSLRRRIFVRSWKIWLLFTLLNVIALLAIGYNSFGVLELVTRYLGEWQAIYIKGSNRKAVFEILLPISYILLLSIPLIALHRLYPRFIYACTAVTVILCIAADLLKLSLFNAYMVSAGLLGMAAGITNRENIERASESVVSVSLILGVYWIVNTIWPDAYLTQIYATLAMVFAIYALARQLNPNRLLFRQVVLLGQYSLFSYIVQILILQVYFRFIAGWGHAEYLSYGIIIITALLVWGAVYVLGMMRDKNKMIDSLYRTVFA